MVGLVHPKRFGGGGFKVEPDIGLFGVCLIRLSGRKASRKLIFDRDNPAVYVGSVGRFRIESTGMIGMLMVSDGTTMWTYMRQLNQYSKFPLGQALARSESSATEVADGAAIQSEGGMAMFGSSFNPLYGYRKRANTPCSCVLLAHSHFRYNTKTYQDLASDLC